MRALIACLSIWMAIGITSASAADAISITYQYDTLGRIIKVTQGNQVTTYAYDAAGNRTAQTVTGGKARFVVLPLRGGAILSLR